MIESILLPAVIEVSVAFMQPQFNIKRCELSAHLPTLSGNCFKVAMGQLLTCVQGHVPSKANRTEDSIPDPDERKKSCKSTTEKAKAKIFLLWDVWQPPQARLPLLQLTAGNFVNA